MRDGVSMKQFLASEKESGPNLPECSEDFQEVVTCLANAARHLGVDAWESDTVQARSRCSPGSDRDDVPGFLGSIIPGEQRALLSGKTDPERRTEEV